MKEEVPGGNIEIPIELLNVESSNCRNISVSMLRLDLAHPIISGNNIFKLHYFLEEAKSSIHKQIITFGGAWSNHMAATAFACKAVGLKCIGFVRGEKPGKFSHTLEFCKQNKMRLEFITRSSYKKINEEKFAEELTKKYGAHILVPEGGFSEKGTKGAELIHHYFNQNNYSHVCCPVGTATTFAGLIRGSEETEIVGFVILKNLNDTRERLETLGVPSSKRYSVIEDYNFGGYAKKNNELISFMNSFYDHNKIPLDFVYTGKMMFGINDLIDKNYFPKGSKILCIHTGGLQGNQSLPDGMLNF